MLARIRADQPEKRHIRLHRPDKIEVACDNVIDQVRDLTGETISRGLAVRLVNGTETKIAGRWFRSSAYGDLVRPRNPVEKSSGAASVLARVNHLAEINRAKSGQ